MSYVLEIRTLNWTLDWTLARDEVTYGYSDPDSRKKKKKTAQFNARDRLRRPKTSQDARRNYN